MKKIANRVFRILTSRLSLNILVWLFFADTVYNNNVQAKAPLHESGYVLHIVVVHLVWMLLIYGNTMLLIPRLLLRRLYGWYLGAVLVYAGFFTWLIGWYSEWLLKAYPGTRKWYYIAVNTPSRSDFSSYADYFFNVYTSSVLITLILFTLGCLMQYFFKERRRSELLEKKQLESELMLLRSQVNPHFLFNVLNSIYSLALKKSDDAPGVILRLSDILRYMLYESRQEYVPLEKELQMLRDYIEIEKIRLSDKHALSLTISGSSAGLHIAPAMLISFVENGIKHGLDSRATDAFLLIDIRIDRDGELHFLCRNNYLPRNRNGHTSKVGGIGLENVRKRLQLLYGGQHSIAITNENNIFEVKLNLKLSADDLPHN